MRIYAIKIFEKPVVIKRFEHRGNKPTKPVEILLQGKQSKSSINYFA